MRSKNYNLKMAETATAPTTQKKTKKPKKRTAATVIKCDSSNKQILKSLDADTCARQESLETLNKMILDFSDSMLHEIDILMKMSGKKTVQQVEVFAALQNIIIDKNLRESCLIDVRDNMHKYDVQTKRKKLKKEGEPSTTPETAVPALVVAQS